ncbi:NAD-dependent deacylase [Marinihelvus fidelis]|uniref:NAD-dependent protein deacylase n=1 Tax=Marinihelvus fidelis TaxID=2613842 RepID=A0A5N0TBT4_9GAMM|nr:NAD-dependent deacylase [Marinihelvus fidelis]KAA9132472.1 NAD-dependent deacylase [Marinihelvus fidelis]
MNGESAPGWPNDAVRRIAAANNVLVLTGAGMSAESGIATFRDAQTGLWAKFRPEDLATPQAFHEHPRRVWQWYDGRRQQVAAAEPHAGYRVLVELEKRFRHFAIATQNVDGLHQRAGSQRVFELHGNIMRTVCAQTGRPIDDEWLCEHPGEPPPSPYQPGVLARPDVVWFGETLPEGAHRAAVRSAAQADICLVIGTSSLVYPAAGLPAIAAERGAMVIEVNPDETPLTASADVIIRAPASAALVALASHLGH